MDAIQRKRDKARLRVRKFRAIKKALQEIEEPTNAQDESLGSFSIKSEDLDIEDSMGIPSANPPSNFEFVDFAISELQPILARDFALQEKETEVEQQQKKRLKQEEDENFQKYVVKELIRIRSQLEDIQHGQQQLANKLNSAGVIEPTPLDAIDKFMEEYSLTLPFKTVGDFERFDVTLAANPTLRAKFMSSLLDLFDRNHVATKTLVNIMKKYMSRDVALSYTAVKPVKDKYVLKGTTFCKCIISVLLKNHIDKNTGIKATEHNLLSALGSVLANAKDWEGYRARRSKPVPRYDDF
ncbi:uncharacterized protein LOC127286326 isoform X2 [Leptopilina boulardi]|uniref:uncharacterized protein LOC127286326 isoform X2 n=1 Tax=Leptopilina boulardi TaxID=63433 RepID=UPI0021F5391C|nr:uncharacterized protein LOC127286326 isoform X2 [Leptopilina boulardi]